jgi:hypothetical protein
MAGALAIVLQAEGTNSDDTGKLVSAFAPKADIDRPVRNVS